MAKAKNICLSEKSVPWDEATHVLWPAAKYGVGVFEGVCGYLIAARELYVFRPMEHMGRLRYCWRFMCFGQLVEPDKFIDGTIKVVSIVSPSVRLYRSFVNFRKPIFDVVDGNVAAHPESRTPLYQDIHASARC
jgi:hypothetical protein